MTIKEIAYMILEGIRAGYIVDDERIDIRLIYDWIDLKREVYIRSRRNNNPNSLLNLDFYQVLPLTTEVKTVSDAGDYPYNNSTTQLYKIVESKESVPNIMEDKNGPIIYSLETLDLMKLPFSIVSYNHMKFAGNGKFNSKIIFGSYRDNKIYFKYNTFFDTYDKVVLRAVFLNPRKVGDYDIDTSFYPATNDMVEFIKNSVYEVDIKLFYGGSTDEINDASGKINNN